MPFSCFTHNIIVPLTNFTLLVCGLNDKFEVEELEIHSQLEVDSEPIYEMSEDNILKLKGLFTDMFISVPTLEQLEGTFVYTSCLTVSVQLFLQTEIVEIC